MLRVASMVGLMTLSSCSGWFEAEIPDTEPLFVSADGLSWNGKTVVGGEAQSVARELFGDDAREVPNGVVYDDFGIEVIEDDRIRLKCGVVASNDDPLSAFGGAVRFSGTALRCGVSDAQLTSMKPYERHATRARFAEGRFQVWANVGRSKRICKVYKECVTSIEIVFSPPE